MSKCTDIKCLQAHPHDWSSSIDRTLLHPTTPTPDYAQALDDILVHDPSCPAYHDAPGADCLCNYEHTKAAITQLIEEQKPRVTTPTEKHMYDRLLETCKHSERLPYVGCGACLRELRSYVESQINTSQLEGRL